MRALTQYPTEHFWDDVPHQLFLATTSFVKLKIPFDSNFYGEPKGFPQKRLQISLTQWLSGKFAGARIIPEMLEIRSPGLMFLNKSRSIEIQWAHFFDTQFGIFPFYTDPGLYFPVLYFQKFLDIKNFTMR